MIAARTGALCIGTDRSVAAIRERGITLVQGETTTVARPEAVTRLDRPVSLLVVAVKAYDLEEALERVDAGRARRRGGPAAPQRPRARRSRSGRTSKLVLLRHKRCLSSRPGSIGAVEAYSPEPGLVVQETPGARITAACEALAAGELERSLAPLRVPGLEVVVADRERAVLWEKAARLAVLAAATVASGATVGTLRVDASWSGRLREAVREACAVAAADGVALDPAGQWAIIEALPGDLIPSTARDARAGRPTELDAITGSVLRAGQRAGVPTPALEELFASAVRSLAAA